MSSETRDSALLGGQPEELFRITRGGIAWLYTNADRVITVGTDSYTPAPIAHDKITDGGDTNQRSINITIPKTLPVVDNWRPYPPSDTVAITILTRHQGETDYLVDWIGRLMAPVFDDTKLTLTSEPSQTRNKNGGKSRIWQLGCDLVHYSQGPGLCNVVKADHALPATLTAAIGTTLTATAFGTLPSGRLAGGWLQWTRPDGTTDWRSIDSHTGTSVVVTYGATDFATALAVVAYPGCAGTYADCTYYANTNNYGGELWIPGRDYYDGNPVR